MSSPSAICSSQLQPAGDATADASVWSEWPIATPYMVVPWRPIADPLCPGNLSAAAEIRKRSQC